MPLVVTFVSLFRYYKELAERAIAQVTGEGNVRQILVRLRGRGRRLGFSL